MTQYYQQQQQQKMNISFFEFNDGLTEIPVFIANCSYCLNLLEFPTKYFVHSIFIWNIYHEFDHSNANQKVLFHFVIFFFKYVTAAQKYLLWVESSFTFDVHIHILLDEYKKKKKQQQFRWPNTKREIKRMCFNWIGHS